MADVVTTQKLLDDARNLVMKFTNFSDGTGENLVTKINVATLNPPVPGLHLKLWSYAYDIKLLNLRIQWEGTPNTDLLVLGGFANAIDCGGFGGVWNNAPQPTGNVLFTTNGATLGASYSVILEFKKGVQGGT